VEYTFALLLALLRRVMQADGGMRAGQWSRDPLVGEALEGKTLGIVGFGAVGGRVARIAAGFGMHVIAAAGRGPDAAPKPVPVLPLMEMLAVAGPCECRAVAACGRTDEGCGAPGRFGCRAGDPG